MRLLGRLRSRFDAPSIRVLREAGPPVAWLVIAGVLGIAAVIVLFVAGVRSPLVLVATPLVAFLGACAADRDGWQIRMAIAELAARQRERWRSGTLPIDPVAAETWLTTHPDAPVLERAAVMATANRPADGLALLEGATGETPEDTVRIARLRITLAGSAGRGLDRGSAIAAFEALPELAAVPVEEARYQRLSLAWSLAWNGIHRREPWRRFFADAIRDLGPFRSPVRLRVVHATQQYAFPIAYALAWLIVSGLGLDGGLF